MTPSGNHSHGGEKKAASTDQEEEEASQLGTSTKVVGGRSQRRTSPLRGPAAAQAMDGEEEEGGF